jgi:hypothetical protein
MFSDPSARDFFVFVKRKTYDYLRKLFSHKKSDPIFFTYFLLQLFTILKKESKKVRKKERKKVRKKERKKEKVVKLR